MKDVEPLLLDLSVFNTQGVNAFTGAVAEQTAQFHHKWFSYMNHIGRQCPPGDPYADFISTELDDACEKKKNDLYDVYLKSWMDQQVRQERKNPEEVKKVLTDLDLFLDNLREEAKHAWEKDVKKLETRTRATVQSVLNNRCSGSEGGPK